MRDGRHLNRNGSKHIASDEQMHHHGAFCLPGGKHSAGGLYPPRAVEGADSAFYRKASQSPHDIFQLAESVIVGNTLPPEVTVPQRLMCNGGDAI